MKLGFLYAGQGSQHPGMGADLYERFPTFRAVLDSAAEQVDFDLKEVSFTDTKGILNQTRYTQPCMVAFAAGMLCCAFAMMGGNFPLLVAGFMLLGLMYGGNMCSMSAMVGTFFGPKYYGINYAIATCQMIPAAIVGPQILALSQMGSGSYLGAFWVFFGVAIAALAVSFFIKPPKPA